MLRTHVILPAVALSLIATPALAELVLVEPRSEETIGATTIEWDSSFEDLEYTEGATIEMTVTWDVIEGAASFAAFNLRPPNFTPKGPDPATGTLEMVGPVTDSGPAPSDGSVIVDFRFDELHCDEDLGVLIGNAHFSLVLRVDEDGDGDLDDEFDFGVNVHVEDGAC